MTVFISVIDSISIRFISSSFISIDIIRAFVGLSLVSSILCHAVIALSFSSSFIPLGLEAMLLYPERIRLDVGSLLLALLGRFYVNCLYD